MSARKLSHLIGARKGVKPESVRRQISRWKSGEQPITPENAELLSELLGVPAEELGSPPFSKALSVAGAVVRRLEAGERLPPETLLRVAEATQQAGEAALLLADRLRREAAAHG